jgi:hypothetical protein
MPGNVNNSAAGSMDVRQPQVFRCVRQPLVVPIPPQVTQGALYSRRLTRPRAPRREGYPLELSITAVSDSVIHVAALHDGAPQGTDLAFYPTATDVDPATDPALARAVSEATASQSSAGALLELPGGPGWVEGALTGLQPNTRYTFTVGTRFRYARSEQERAYWPADARGRPRVFALWTHGPAALVDCVGRRLRFTRGGVNRVRASIVPAAGVGAAPPVPAIAESVRYDVHFYPVSAPGVAPDLGAFPAAEVSMSDGGGSTDSTVYAPTELPPGHYAASITAVYFASNVAGGPTDTYISGPFAMSF